MTFMTIKEAMTGTGLHGPLLEPTEPHQRGKEYREKVFQKGIALLKKAGIPGMLNELLEEVKRVYPDAEITDWRAITSREKPDEKAIFAMSWDGSAVIRMKWNSRRPEDETEDQKKMPGSLFSVIAVYAEPVTGDIIISGGKGEARAPYLFWSNPEVKTLIETALVEAYKNPKTEGTGAFATSSSL